MPKKKLIIPNTNLYWLLQIFPSKIEQCEPKLLKPLPSHESATSAGADDRLRDKARAIPVNPS